MIPNETTLFIKTSSMQEIQELILLIEDRKITLLKESKIKYQTRKALDWIGGKRQIKEAKFFLGEEKYLELLKGGLIYEIKELCFRT